MKNNTDSRPISTSSLPSTYRQKYFHQIYIDQEKKERLVNHGLLADKLDAWGIDGFTTASHGITLLHGPPGTGKTTVAKGAADQIARRSQTEIAFRHVRIDQLGSSKLGGTPEAVAEVFEEIRDAAERGVRQIVLLDEIESLAVERSDVGGDTDPDDVRRAVNTALNELDLLAETGNTFIIATSNLRESVDQAFLDRVDESFEIGLPGPIHRARILTDFFEELNENVGTTLPTRPGDLEDLVALTEGLSGRAIRKKARNTLLQEDLAEHPSRLTISHVRDEFMEEPQGVLEREFTFKSRSRANEARESVPDEYLSDADDGRHKTVELTDDAPEGWVTFVAELVEEERTERDRRPWNDPGETGFFWPEALDDGPPERTSASGCTTVTQLNPRLAMLDPTVSSGAATILRKVRDLLGSILDHGNCPHAETVRAVLQDERVKEAVFEYTQLEALEAVHLDVDGFSARVDVSYDGTGTEFLEPPPEHIIPAFSGARVDVRLQVSSSEQDFTVRLPGVESTVSVSCEPTRARGRT